MAKKKSKPRSKRVSQKNLIDEMLEDFSKLSGLDLTEDEEKTEDNFRTFPLQEEPTEDEELDFKNPDGTLTENYFDVLFDDIGVDSSETITEEIKPSP